MGNVLATGISLLTSLRSFDKRSTPADPIAIARDVAQESCLLLPMTEPKRFAQRRGVFVAASAVKEMCDYANGKADASVANLILYGALIVEYAAEFFVENPHRKMSEHKRCVLTNDNDLAII